MDIAWITLFDALLDEVTNIETILKDARKRSMGKSQVRILLTPRLEAIKGEYNKAIMNPEIGPDQKASLFQQLSVRFRGILNTNLLPSDELEIEFQNLRLMIISNMMLLYTAAGKFRQAGAADVLAEMLIGIDKVDIIKMMVPRDHHLFKKRFALVMNYLNSYFLIHTSACLAVPVMDAKLLNIWIAESFDTGNLIIDFQKDNWQPGPDFEKAMRNRSGQDLDKLFANWSVAMNSILQVAFQLSNVFPLISSTPLKNELSFEEGYFALESDATFTQCLIDLKSIVKEMIAELAEISKTHRIAVPADDPMKSPRILYFLSMEQYLDHMFSAYDELAKSNLSSLAPHVQFYLNFANMLLQDASQDPQKLQMVAGLYRDLCFFNALSEQPIDHAQLLELENKIGKPLLLGNFLDMYWDIHLSHMLLAGSNKESHPQLIENFEQFRTQYLAMYDGNPKVLSIEVYHQLIQYYTGKVSQEKLITNLRRKFNSISPSLSQVTNQDFTTYLNYLETGSMDISLIERKSDRSVYIGSSYLIPDLSKLAAADFTGIMLEYIPFNLPRDSVNAE